MWETAFKILEMKQSGLLDRTNLIVLQAVFRKFDWSILNSLSVNHTKWLNALNFRKTACKTIALIRSNTPDHFKYFKGCLPEYLLGILEYIDLNLISCWFIDETFKEFITFWFKVLLSYLRPLQSQQKLIPSCHKKAMEKCVKSVFWSRYIKFTRCWSFFILGAWQVFTVRLL